MRGELIDLTLEFASLLLYAAVSALLTYEGLLSELTAIGRFSTGSVGLGAWYLFMGGLALYAGTVLIGRDILWRRAHSRLR